MPEGLSSYNPEQGVEPAILAHLQDFDEQVRQEVQAPLTALSKVRVDGAIRDVLNDLQIQLASTEANDRESYAILTRGMQEIARLDQKKQTGAAEALDVLNIMRRIGNKQGGSRNVARLLEISGQMRSETEQTQEYKERLFDARLEVIISRYSEKINEGKAGVIFRLDTRNIPESIRRKLAEQGLSLEHGTEAGAIKMLKLFTPEEAQHEAAMQQQACDILKREGKAGKPDYAQVPQLWFTRTLNVRNLKTVEKLRRDGLLQKPNIGNLDQAKPGPVEVNLMIMDYIPGQDLASYFYRRVLQEKGFDKQQTEQLTFSELQGLAGVQLGFEKASPGSSDAGELEVSHSNAKKLFAFLSKSGMKINPRLIEQIRNTVRLNNKNGLFHNDLHWRNVMASGAIEAQSPTDPGKVSSWIIDFELADGIQAEGEYDGAIATTLEKFSLPLPTQKETKAKKKKR